MNLLEGDPDLQSWDFHRFVYRTGLFDSASIEASAAGLIAYVDRLPLDQYGRIALVGHSVGGLIAKEAVLRSAPLQSRLAALILLAAPTAGLRLSSLIGFLNPGLRDLGVGGRKINEMNERWLRLFGHHPPFVVQSVAAADDKVAPMVPSSVSENVPIVVPGSHSGILREAASPVASTIRDILVRVVPAGLSGYRRIQGALANLGYQVGRGTIANILKEHGLEPAPERKRKTTWKEFLIPA